MYSFAKYRGGKVYCRSFNKHGIDRIQTIPFCPSLYVETPEPSDFKSINGNNLKKISFDDNKEFKNFLETQKDTDVNLYGTNQPIFQYMHEYSDITPDDRSVFLKYLNIFIIDIETSGTGFPDVRRANHLLSAITIYSSKTEVYTVFALKHSESGQSWSKENSILHNVNLDKINYKEFDDEEDMCASILDFWTTDYPHVISGWNTAKFDIPFISNKIKNVLGESEWKKLSPFNIINEQEKRDNFGNDYQDIDIFGIQHLDYLELYRKHTFTSQERYSLDHIGQVEVNESKIAYDGSLYTLWQSDHQKFIDYNIKDVNLVYRIDQVKQLFNLVFDIAYLALINFEDTYSPVKTWESLIFHQAKTEKILPPIRKHIPSAEAYEGAYVKDPQIGKHKWVMSFDMTSLYPSIIRWLNIGYDTLVDQIDMDVNRSLDLLECHSTNFTMASNGTLYRKDIHSIFARMMIMSMTGRSDAKNKMKENKKLYEKTKDQQYKDKINLYNTRQLALKTLGNSAYGACGNKYFAYYDTRIAEAITLTGQTVIRWSEKYINEYLNSKLKTNKDYVIAMDTDSCYVSFDALVNKIKPKDPIEFLDKVAKQMEKDLFSSAFAKLSELFNAYEPSALNMKREAIADSALFVAKKRYAMQVWDNEGVRFSTPDLKIMGLEIVKKDYPKIVRENLKKSVELILNNDDEKVIHEFIANFKREFWNIPIEDISIIKSVSFIDKYRDGKSWNALPGCPFNTRAALNYNSLIEKNKLEKKYSYIIEGDKVNIVWLTSPNKFKFNLIAYNDNVPDEFRSDIEAVIDRDRTWITAFIDPLEGMLSTCGWSTIKKTTLDDWF